MHRHAAYDLKKRRGKALITRVGGHAPATDQRDTHVRQALVATMQAIGIAA